MVTAHPSTTAHRPSVLIVDDDDTLRTRLARAFTERCYDATHAANVDEARRVASQDPPEYAVIDLRMPGGSGLELVAWLKDLDPATKIVILTGYGSIATAVEAMRLGATSYLPKPADVDDIITAFAEKDAAPSPCEPDYPTPSLARAEWEHINRVLSDSDGNISLAARRLGLHRRSLQRKLAKFPPQH